MLNIRSKPGSSPQSWAKRGKRCISIGFKTRHEFMELKPGSNDLNKQGERAVMRVLLFLLQIQCCFDKIQNERSVCIDEWSEVSEHE